MPFRRHRDGGDLCAIFVHAGAGYHSHANEKHHLAAVEDASKIAMTLLKNGGEALDAVEIAIKLLEDREITNAGYGSNLTIEGKVECDATVVDHFGRSGAVGAVSNVRNPIGLARLVLEESTKALSLQRVPPNLLVGPGAADFAFEKGLPVLPDEFLISPNARERWVKWKKDLRVAECHQTGDLTLAQRSTPAPAEHFGAVAVSPPTSPPDCRDLGGSLTPLDTHATTRLPGASTTDLNPSHINSRGELELQAPPPNVLQEPSAKGSSSNLRSSEWYEEPEPGAEDNTRCSFKRPRTDGSFDRTEPPLSTSGAVSTEPTQSSDKLSDKEDNITDTVGAIAVDCFGNIAAGSSSGGIGMKHRGRCGPAALVGIGTAVLPMNAMDETRTCMATVTSGTGEHMATTMAANTANERIYSCTRKSATSGELQRCSEEEAMQSVIKDDFMAHPGVRNSHCAGAIGIMTVKKMKDGIFLYFGHNTDSFAIASMSSEDKRPLCTMSRSQGSGSLAMGGRAARFKQRGKRVAALMSGGGGREKKQLPPQ